MPRPLRYEISDWHQLSKCQSNNSRDLKIHVTDFIQDERLQGLRICLKHRVFGTLFACVLDSKGSMISNFAPNMVYELTKDQILAELRKYGYLITFKEYNTLPGNQLQYLMTLDQLGYDKIRILSVWSIENGCRKFEPNIVVFKVEPHPQWLNAGYSASLSEFTDALVDGSALNITNISNTLNFQWDWLVNWVADIDDILSNNGGTACL